MRQFKDTSHDHRTQLEATVQVGHRREKVCVAVIGRDVWAYQMAKIELQNRYLQAQKQLSKSDTN